MPSPVIEPSRQEHDAPEFLRVTRGGWKSGNAMKGGMAWQQQDHPYTRLRPYAQDILAAYRRGSTILAIAEKFDSSAHCIRKLLNEYEE